MLNVPTPDAQTASRIATRLLAAALLWSAGAVGLEGMAWAQDGPAALKDEAIASNPTLDAMRSREQALRTRSEVAGAWPDPMVSIEYSNAPITTWSISDHPMGGLQLRAQQTLLAPAWSRLGRDVGERRADVAGHMTDEAALRLTVMVEKTWWALARTRLLEAVTQDNLARTEELLEAARARYETGMLGQHAVLRLEVLRDTLGDDLHDFTRTERELQAALSEALGRTPGDAFDTPATVATVLPPTAQDWLATATANRPRLQAIDAQRRVAEGSAELARAEGRIDPSVWAGYRLRTMQSETDPGTDLVSIGIGVPIPTGSGRRANGARTAALQEAQAASQDYAAALDSVAGDMAAVLARWERAATKAQTYQDRLIPGAQATLDTTLADFSVGRADFASLFEAEVALLALERARITAAIDTHLHHADATAVLGLSPLGVTP